ARVVIVEGHDHILQMFHPSLSKKACQALAKIGVEVFTSCRVVDIQPDHVLVAPNDQREDTRRFDANTILWAAGVQATPLAKKLADAFRVETDRIGRIKVQPDLTLAGHPEVFVVGDMMNLEVKGKALPGVAPVAIQQGIYAAKRILGRLKGETAAAPFAYYDKGSMATIGRAAAVVESGWIRFTGLFAWFAWLFIHLAYLVQGQSRILVLIQWGWNYISWNRSARLITNQEAQMEASVADRVVTRDLATSGSFPPINGTAPPSAPTTTPAAAPATS
ncbi:MAG: NAD(P)/FAD-dependent oxidoreductase, partial [Planctomycetia bacterium]